MKYGILIYPPREVQDKANAFRKRYDSHYALIPPHITIKEPFEVNDDVVLDQIINAIEEVVRETPPFSLKISKVSTFIPTTQVVYFGFEKSPAIDVLNEKLNSGILHRELKYPTFIPHITIAQDLPKEELHDIHNRLRLHNYNYDVPVDRIHLVYQLENETWATYQTFVLQGKLSR